MIIARKPNRENVGARTCEVWMIDESRRRRRRLRMSVIPSIVVVECTLAQEGAKADVAVLERHD